MTAQELSEHVVALPPEARHQAEDFIVYLSQKYAPAQTPTASRVRGTPGKELLRFAGTIEADDLELMQKAIDEDFGKVDPNEW